MAESRPSMQSVQKSLIMGVLLGLIFGCLIGGALGLYYAWMVNPAVYSEGAYPNNLAPGYQSHYVDMVVDSYVVNKQVDFAKSRLQSFDDTDVIVALGERSVAFVANGQAVEAQAVNDLAMELSAAEGWDPNVIAAQVSTLAVKYQNDAAKAQAVNTYGGTLGVVPSAGAAPPPADAAPSTDGVPSEQPAPSEGQAPPPTEDSGGGFPFMTIIYCVLGLVLIVVVVLLIGNWYFKKSRSGPRGPQIEWDQEGPPPIIQWSGTYTLGQDNYDEFFTVETPDGDFLGESGVGILEVIPGTSPKQVTAFDVGLFDKTDITTLSRVLMTPQAFNDPSFQAKIEANQMAEAVLAEPGKEFSLETSALLVTATIDELAFDSAEEYFEKLKVTLNVFVNEGADLKIGQMDVPEAYQG